MKLFCKHYWEFVKAWREPDTRFDTPHFFDWVIIYCPLCRKRKIVSAHEWETISKIQEINKQYNHAI